MAYYTYLAYHTYLDYYKSDAPALQISHLVTCLPGPLGWLLSHIVRDRYIHHGADSPLRKCESGASAPRPTRRVPSVQADPHLSPQAGTSPEALRHSPYPPSLFPVSTQPCLALHLRLTISATSPLYICRSSTFTCSLGLTKERSRVLCRTPPYGYAYQSLLLALADTHFSSTPWCLPYCILGACHAVSLVLAMLYPWCLPC